MTWCEEQGVDRGSGLARNSRLCRRIAKAMYRSRRFRRFRYRTLKSRSRKRRVVAKAEWLPGQRGDNPRLAVTSLPGNRVDARTPCEDLHCGCGDMEDRVKEQQLRPPCGPTNCGCTSRPLPASW